MAINELVADYLNGDEGARDLLIKELEPIAKQLISRYSTRVPMRADDIYGNAYLGLVQAVDWLPTRLVESEKCEAYVFMTIRRFITVGTTKVPGLAYDTLIQVPHNSLEQRSEEFIDVLSLDAEDANSWTIGTTEAVDPNPNPKLELDLLIDNLNLSPIEAGVLELKMENYTCREIAAITDMSKSSVSLIMIDIQNKFTGHSLCG